MLKKTFVKLEILCQLIFLTKLETTFLLILKFKAIQSRHVLIQLDFTNTNIRTFTDI